MSKIDGTDPAQLHSSAELFVDHFSESSFVDVPLNAEQLLSAVDYMQEALLRMPAGDLEVLVLRRTVRNTLGVYESALDTLRQRQAAPSTSAPLETSGIDPMASEELCSADEVPAEDLVEA
jgi:hypothetical protein